MEAKEMLRAMRSAGGLSQTALAKMANVAPSTVSRIERGDIDPTWSVMSRLMESSGYQSQSVLKSSGDIDAVVAARTVLGEYVLADASEAVRAWIDRWTRAGFVDAFSGVPNVEKVCLQAGIAARLFSRKNDEISLVYDRSWQTIVTSLKENGVKYAVTGIAATSPTRVDDGAAWPIIYVENLNTAVEASGMTEQVTLGPSVSFIEFDSVSGSGLVDDNGFMFVSPAQALVDSYAGPGRMPDQADAVAASWQDQLALSPHHPTSSNMITR